MHDGQAGGETTSYVAEAEADVDVEEEKGGEVGRRRRGVPAVSKFRYTLGQKRRKISAKHWNLTAKYSKTWMKKDAKRKHLLGGPGSPSTSVAGGSRGQKTKMNPKVKPEEGSTGLHGEEEIKSFQSKMLDNAGNVLETADPRKGGEEGGGSDDEATTVEGRPLKRKRKKKKFDDFVVVQRLKKKRKVMSPEKRTVKDGKLSPRRRLLSPAPAGAVHRAPRTDTGIGQSESRTDSAAEQPVVSPGRSRPPKRKREEAEGGDDKSDAKVAKEDGQPSTGREVRRRNSAHPERKERRQSEETDGKERAQSEEKNRWRRVSVDERNLRPSREKDQGITGDGSEEKTERGDAAKTDVKERRSLRKTEDKERKCYAETAGRRRRSSSASNDGREAASSTPIKEPPSPAQPIKTRDMETRSSRKLEGRDGDAGKLDATTSKRSEETSEEVETSPKKTEERTFKTPKRKEEKDFVRKRRERRVSGRRKRGESSPQGVEEPGSVDSGSQSDKDKPRARSEEGQEMADVDIKEEEQEREEGGRDSSPKMKRDNAEEVSQPRSPTFDDTLLSESKEEPMETTTTSDSNPTVAGTEDRKLASPDSSSDAGGSSRENGETVGESGAGDSVLGESGNGKEKVKGNGKTELNGREMRSRDNSGAKTTNKENVGESERNEAEDGRRREERDMSDRESVKERRRKEKHEHKREKILKIQLEQPEHRLLQMDDEIKRCLLKENFDVGRCLSVLEDLEDFTVDVGLLKDNPDILRTVAKCRRFKVSTEVTYKAEVIYNRWKDAFLSFDWPAEKEEERKNAEHEDVQRTSADNSGDLAEGGEKSEKGSGNSSAPVPPTDIVSSTLSSSSSSSPSSHNSPATDLTTTTTASSRPTNDQTEHAPSETADERLPAEKFDPSLPAPSTTETEVRVSRTGSSGLEPRLSSDASGAESATAATERVENSSPVLAQVEGDPLQPEKPSQTAVPSETIARSSQDAGKETALAEEPSSGEPVLSSPRRSHRGEERRARSREGDETTTA